MLNRQARMPGEPNWTSYGNVTLAQAAEIHFQKHDDGFGTGSNVYVRDEEDKHEFVLFCHFEYSKVQVSNLRGNI